MKRCTIIWNLVEKQIPNEPYYKTCLPLKKENSLKGKPVIPSWLK